jgi:hypothetical protein
MQRGGTQRWMALLAVMLALLLRGAIPVGYMIGADASGALTIELCSGRTMAMPMRHGDQPDRPREMPCPYGVLGAPAMPSPPPVVAQPRVALQPMADAPRAPALLRPQAAAPPPPATGPPSA